MTAYEELKAELKKLRKDVDALMGDKTLSDDYDPFDDDMDKARNERCLALSMAREWMEKYDDCLRRTQS